TKRLPKPRAARPALPPTINPATVQESKRPQRLLGSLLCRAVSVFSALGPAASGWPPPAPGRRRPGETVRWAASRRVSSLAHDPFRGDGFRTPAPCPGPSGQGVPHPFDAVHPLLQVFHRRGVRQPPVPLGAERASRDHRD